MHNKGKLENNSGLNQVTKVSDSEKPNIILVVMDSLRYDHVGTNRGSSTLTPFLDSLKEKAITFTEAIAQGPSTRVSMTALMSSTYSSMYGGSFRLSKTRPLIHEMLKEAGYTTAGVTANLYLSTDFGWERGFDFFDDCRPEGVYQKKYLWRVANQVGKRVGYPLIWPKSLSAEFVFEAAKRFLKGAESPFFLWVHLMDTHWPYAIQKFSWSEEWKRQRQSDEKLRPRLVSDPPQLNDLESAQLREEYHQSIQYTDHQLKLFIDYLEKKGKLENSWLFLTADHGEEFLDHGRFFHHPTPYEELVHVPLIILPPKNLQTIKSRKVNNQVRLIDLGPTFLDLAGTSPPEDVQLAGTSFTQLIHDRHPNTDLPAVTESPHNQALAIRQDGWKYIWELNNDKRMLFNLKQDPMEKENLVANDLHQAEYFQNALEKHLSMVQEFAKSSNEDQEIEISQEIKERLRDLGYVD